MKNNQFTVETNLIQHLLLVYMLQWGHGKKPTLNHDDLYFKVSEKKLIWS